MSSKEFAPLTLTYYSLKMAAIALLTAVLIRCLGYFSGYGNDSAWLYVLSGIVASGLEVYVFFMFKKMLNQLFQFDKADNWLKAYLLYLLVAAVIVVIAFVENNLFWEQVAVFVELIGKGILLGIGLLLMKLSSNLYSFKDFYTKTVIGLCVSTIILLLWFSIEQWLIPETALIPTAVTAFLLLLTLAKTIFFVSNVIVQCLIFWKAGEEVGK